MPFLTNYGQQVCLYDDNRTFLAGPLTVGTPATHGGIAQIADTLALYSGALSSGTASKDASVLTLVDPAGGGYAGDITITKSVTHWVDPSASSGDTQIVLQNKVFTATGSPMNDVGGAYIQDEESNVLALWERSSDITLATNDTITADALTIRII